MLATNSHNLKKCKYIANVSAPIYQEGGLKSLENLKLIEICVKEIFSKASKKHVTSIAIPILGGGAGGFFFSQVSKTLIDAVCE